MIDKLNSVSLLLRWYIKEVIRVVKCGDVLNDWPAVWEGRAYLASCDGDFPKAMRILDDQHRKLRWAENRARRWGR